MKFICSICIFVFTLTVSIQSLAEGTHAAPEKQAHRDNGALFPPKKMDKSLTTVPEKAQLLEPAAMSTVPGDSITLKWKEGIGATGFHLQVATDPQFKWLKVDENLYKQTSYELKGLEPNHHYYWRVASQRPANNAGYSTSDFSQSMFETTTK